ncbi:DsrE family protein [Candidatus Xianfuyuplasma coldseepsis]|uniref:DsrE family protein n=1 Tax=Candidatus Xianfuyuplasma coldseepsis TaxID=2782163 RepID=A0A7L7KT61_9MOLU|nr:DsrE family protein [Xianfuyuplasma coldseepsis]QMS85795.1 DsrE family protein [Xianfuyuplasma coldseepsis]
MKTLLIVWKSNNDIDIHNFVIPYAYNAKRHQWFDHVQVLIWGASQEVVAATPLIQQRVMNLIKNGVEVLACKMCATNIGAAETLESLGVDVRYTGDFLSEQLQNPDCEVLTI